MNVHIYISSICVFIYQYQLAKLNADYDFLTYLITCKCTEVVTKIMKIHLKKITIQICK